tara:strand:+ start:559 stop:732 length:174 start_codon:yes stop_codon:yes gene_type:complete
MDPLQWTMYILGGLLGGGIVCFICKWPLKKINEEIIYGEGCCNKYFGWCAPREQNPV